VISFLTCIGLVISGLIAYANKVTVPGWTSLFVAVLLLGAVQLICLGLLGEYVGRIYAATQNRPRYLVAYDTATKSKAPTPRQSAEGEPVGPEGADWTGDRDDEQHDVAFAHHS